MNKDTITVANPFVPESVDVLIVLGAIVLVSLFVFLCVLLFRKDGKLPHKHHHRRHRKSYREQSKNTTSGIKELIQQRRHQRRREHHTIKPTLAETGGL